MHQYARLSLGAVVVLQLIACTQETTSPTAVAHPNPILARSATGKVSNPRATFVFSAPSSSGGAVAGDNRLADGSSSTTAESVYDDGQCGVQSQIFVNKTGDATMDPIGTRSSSKSCPGGASVPRALAIHFGAPLASASGALLPDAGTTFMDGDYTNLHDVTSVASGTAAPRRLVLILRGSAASYCDDLAWGGDGGGTASATIDGVGYASAPVQVTASLLNGRNQWSAVTQPDAASHHVAFCTKNGVVVAAFDVAAGLRAIQKT